MARKVKSKLDPHTDLLLSWLLPVDDGGENMGLVAAAARLKAEKGLSVSAGRLSTWLNAQQLKRSHAARMASLEDRLVMIADGSAAVRKIESEFETNPPPALETLIGMLKVLSANMAVMGKLDKDMMRMLLETMRPVLEAAKLEEKQREGQRDERRLVIMEKKAAAFDRAQAALAEAHNTPGGITPETLAKIERELKLL